MVAVAVVVVPVSALPGLAVLAAVLVAAPVAALVSAVAWVPAVVGWTDACVPGEAVGLLALERELEKEDEDEEVEGEDEEEDVEVTGVGLRQMLVGVTGTEVTERAQVPRDAPVLSAPATTTSTVWPRVKAI